MTDCNAIATRVVTTGDESPENPTSTRLDSWKEIAHYLNRNVRTVQRWETLEAMPVHRHCHDAGHSIYAYKHEIDAWRLNRSQEKRPRLRVSAIRKTPLDSLAPAEQAALLRLLAVLVEDLHDTVTRSTAGLPGYDGLQRGAVTEGLVFVEGPKGPNSVERMTIGDTAGMPLLVACTRLKVDK